MTVQYIDPVAQPHVKPTPYTLHADLNAPVRVALVANAIVDCDKLLTAVGEALRARRPNITTTLQPTGKGTAADEDVIDRIAENYDVAVCAIGHCGSCTAGTVRDGVRLAQRGVPAVTLVTDIFWDQAAALSSALGWPDAPRVRLPYPVWGTGDDAIAETAHQAADAIIQAIETPHARAA